jgi:predicted DNA binding protein
MAIIADVTVPPSTLPPGDALKRTDTYIEFARHVAVNGDPHQYIRVTDTADLDAFEAAVDEDERVRELVAIDRTAAQPMYRIEFEHPPPCPSLYRSDLLIEQASGTPDEWIFRIRTSDGETLRAVQHDCHERDVHFDVRRLDRSSPTTASDRYGLTDGQYEALVTAFEEGFFEVPRRTNLVEIGEKLGISGQAASERLRRAERKIVRTTVLAESAPTPE